MRGIRPAPSANAAWKAIEDWIEHRQKGERLAMWLANTYLREEFHGSAAPTIRSPRFRDGDIPAPSRTNSDELVLVLSC
jgi:hypothetical protein